MGTLCDIFISYRRDGGLLLAKGIASELQKKGYSVFFDGESLKSGNYKKTIRRAISSCTDFVCVLSPNCLDRCANGIEEDVVASEIHLAMSLDKNIVPVMFDGFTFPKPMPKCIEGLEDYNAGDSINPNKPQQISQAILFKIENGFFKSKPSGQLGKGDSGGNASVSAQSAASSVHITQVFAQEPNRPQPQPLSPATVVLPIPEGEEEDHSKISVWSIAGFVVLCCALFFGAYWFFSGNSAESGEVSQTTTDAGTVASDGKGKSSQATGKSKTTGTTTGKVSKKSGSGIIPSNVTSPGFAEFAGTPQVAKHAQSCMDCYERYEKLKTLDSKHIDNQMSILEYEKISPERANQLRLENSVLETEAHALQKEIRNHFAELPPPPPTTYTVVRGDTANRIARKCGVSFEDLRAANPGVNLYRLSVGQVIQLPQKSQK